MDEDRARELLMASLESLEVNQDVAARLLADAGPEPMDRTVEQERREIADALARLDAGTYGRCLVCGREIDDERLSIRPEAATCREHADVPVVT